MSGENVDVSGGSSPVDALGALPLARGTRLRQYILEDTLGAGGFGIPYRARHEMLTSKSFAIKEYYPRDYACATERRSVVCRESATSSASGSRASPGSRGERG